MASIVQAECYTKVCTKQAVFHLHFLPSGCASPGFCEQVDPSRKHKNTKQFRSFAIIQAFLMSTTELPSKVKKKKKKRKELFWLALASELWLLCSNSQIIHNAAPQECVSHYLK